jgi:hypothetical protein
MKANRKSWKINPISKEKVAMDIYAEYSAVEYKKMSEGFQPYDMDQKWFVYMEDDTLWFHRSWTGVCIYEVKFINTGDKHIIKEAWADGLKDLDDIKIRNYWSKIVLFLIDAILLGKKAVMPEPEEYADDPAQSFVFRFHMFGHQGVSQLELDVVAEVMKEIIEKKKNREC